MANYIPYSSIDKFRKRNTEKFEGHNVVLTEKIHGSNFQIVVSRDPINIRFGKRSGYLVDGENFFGYEQTMDPYKCRVTNALNALEAQNMTIIGEYYGGNLNGTKSAKATTVQKGVYSNYSADNEFAIYEVIIDKIWYSWDQVKEFATKYGFTHVPEIARGPWESFAEFDVNSLRSQLAKSDSPAEGVVIRLETQDANVRGIRVKWKCDSMLESPRQIKIKGSHEDDNMRYCYGMMNQPRFDCYLSKVGPEEFTDANIGNNIKELVADTIIDIEDKFGNEIEIKKMRKKLSAIARKFIFEYMQNA
jgi:Rnl2 family RNA ligase